MVMRIIVVAAMLAGACKDDGKASAQVDADPTIDAPPDRCGPDTTIGYMKMCDKNVPDQCGTCECRQLEHAALCDPTCTTDADCPQPSQGCGVDGYCRD